MKEEFQEIVPNRWEDAICGTSSSRVEWRICCWTQLYYGSSSEIMHVVDDDKDNELYDFYFDYSWSIFLAVFHLASALATIFWIQYTVEQDTASKICLWSV